MRLFVVLGGIFVLVFAVVILTFSMRSDEDEGTRQPLTPETREAVSPDVLVDIPESAYRQPIRVSGEVVAIGRERRFALRGNERAVLVQLEPGIDSNIELGERVEVFGTLNRISRIQAVGIGELAGAPTEEGAPFVHGKAVRPVAS